MDKIENSNPAITSDANYPWIKDKNDIKVEKDQHDNTEQVNDNVEADDKSNADTNSEYSDKPLIKQECIDPTTITTTATNPNYYPCIPGSGDANMVRSVKKEPSSEAEKSEAEQSEVKLSEAEQSEAEQSEVKLSEAEQSEVKLSEAEQSEAEQSDAKLSEAEQSEIGDQRSTSADVAAAATTFELADQQDSGAEVPVQVEEMDIDEHVGAEACGAGEDISKPQQQVDEANEEMDVDEQGSAEVCDDDDGAEDIVQDDEKVSTDEQCNSNIMDQQQTTPSTDSTKLVSATAASDPTQAKPQQLKTNSSIADDFRKKTAQKSSLHNPLSPKKIVQLSTNNSITNPTVSSSNLKPKTPVKAKYNADKSRITKDKAEVAVGKESENPTIPVTTTETLNQGF